MKKQSNNTSCCKIILLLVFILTAIFLAILLQEHNNHPEPRLPLYITLLSLIIKSRTKACATSWFKQPETYLLCKKLFMKEPSGLNNLAEHAILQHVNVTSTSEEVPKGDIILQLFSPREENGGVTKDLVLFYIHGGGFVAGNPLLAGSALINRATKEGYFVVAVNYRKAPEYVFPTAVEDVVEAYKWVLKTYPDKKVVPIGDSAGGNLAASLTILARDRNIEPSRIWRQVLIYPATTTATHRDSLESGKLFGKAGYVIDAALCHSYNKLYNPTGVSDPRFVLLANKDFAKLPPAMVITAELDILRSEGELYADKLEEAGVSVHRFQGKMAVHGFLTFPMAQRERLLDEIVKYLEK